MMKLEANIEVHADSHDVYRAGHMSVIFEVYYKQPNNPAKESALTNRVKEFGGRLDYREDATEHAGVCLTYEFDSWQKATEAADALRQLGEHVEGPMDYAA